MDPERLARLIRQHGAHEMARAVHEGDTMFRAALVDGWDLARWRVEATGGALLFWRAADGDPDPLAAAPDAALDALRAERDALAAELRAPLADLDADLEAWNARSRRAGEVNREIARRTGAPCGVATGRGLGRAGDAPPRRGRERPDAMILCVNAPEGERAAWEPVVAGGDVPTTLLMCPRAMPF